MKAKILSLVLTLVMILSLVPTAALAAADDFVIKDGVLEEYNGPGGDVVIPNSVTSIGDGVFWCCESLTSVTIPNSITSIGYGAFYKCTSLTSITIPDSVTSIGDRAFCGCNNLTSVTIPNSMASIGYEAFYKCTSLTSITIPDSVTNIGDYAFSCCTDLTSVTIPGSVTIFGWCAFEGCTSLTSTTIGNGVTNIGWCAFNQCTSLTSITIPGSVTSIGYNAFSGCESLTDTYYGGTEEEWETIGIEDGNEPLQNATIHYVTAVAKPKLTSREKELVLRQNEAGELKLITGTLTPQETVLVACFDENKKFIGVKAITKDQLSADVSEAKSYKLIWINDDLIPQSEAVRVGN